jgi:hypothetical protein
MGRALWMAWWSGVLAVIGLAQGLWAVTGSPCAMGRVRLSLWLSWLAALAAAEASVWLMKRSQAVKRPVEPLPPWERLGGCHPCTASSRPESPPEPEPKSESEPDGVLVGAGDHSERGE